MPIDLTSPRGPLYRGLVYPSTATAGADSEVASSVITRYDKNGVLVPLAGVTTLGLFNEQGSPISASVDSSTPTSNEMIVPAGFRSTELHFTGTANNGAGTCLILLSRICADLPNIAESWKLAKWVVALHLNLTVGTRVGLANTPQVAADLDVDTITQATGTWGATKQLPTSEYDIIDNANNGSAYVRLLTFRATHIRVRFSIGSAASFCPWYGFTS